MKATVLQPPIRTKEEEEVVVGGGLVHDFTKEAVSGFQSNLELRLGMSVGSGGGDLSTTDHHQRKRNTEGGGPQKKRCFADEAARASGYVDPWSLAARQEKAVLEQAIKQLHPFSMASRSIDPPPPPPSSTPAMVGWPPVRSSRRNLGFPLQQQTKSGQKPKIKEEPVHLVEQATSQMENAMDADVDGAVNDNKRNINRSNSSSSSMYVKVNMEGYAVGRKIDLKAHHGYDSLSLALQNMFHNLLSANYSNKSKQDEGDYVLPSPNYVLLYEDNEGDKMLVGDVPWEIFISSVKRLYITLDQRGSQT